jgi:hypothetical protein
MTENSAYTVSEAVDESRVVARTGFENMDPFTMTFLK